MIITVGQLTSIFLDMGKIKIKERHKNKGKILLVIIILRFTLLKKFPIHMPLVIKESRLPVQDT